MEHPLPRAAEPQRRTLDFMLDSLGLRHAHDEVARRDRVAELETTVAALSTENRALRAEVRQLEQQLYPLESEIATFEHEMDGRVALERERAAADRISSGPSCRGSSRKEEPRERTVPWR